MVEHPPDPYVRDMSSWLTRWFGYGLGSAAGKAIFGQSGEEQRPPDAAPIRQQTEAEIRADEKRYDEAARRLEVEAKVGGAAAKRGAHPPKP